MKYLVLLASLCACGKSSNPKSESTKSTVSEPAAYTPAADVPAAIRSAIAASVRSADDCKLDAGRKPGEVLAFFNVASGQRVGELFAGGGYTSELLVRTIGDGGQLFAQNTKEILDKFAR